MQELKLFSLRDNKEPTKCCLKFETSQARPKLFLLRYKVAMQILSFHSRFKNNKIIYGGIRKVNRGNTLSTRVIINA